MLRLGGLFSNYRCTFITKKTTDIGNGWVGALAMMRLARAIVFAGLQLPGTKKPRYLVREESQAIIQLGI